MLENSVKKDYLKFRKEKNENLRDLLMIINWNIKNKKIELKKDKLENWEVIKNFEKELKQIKEEKEILEKKRRNISMIDEKIEYIKKILPKKISEKELKMYIINFIKQNDIDNILNSRWQLFKYLKTNFEWKYDPKDVNNIINNL